MNLFPKYNTVTKIDFTQFYNKDISFYLWISYGGRLDQSYRLTGNI